MQPNIEGRFGIQFRAKYRILQPPTESRNGTLQTLLGREDNFGISACIVSGLQAREYVIRIGILDVL